MPVLRDTDEGVVTRVTFTPSVPREVQQAMRLSLHRWLWLVPSWCHELRVVWDTGLDCPAAMQAQDEYRYAEIIMGPTWLDEDDDERESVVRHELAHLLIAPMVAWVDYAIADMDEHAQETWRRALEGTVSDLTQAFGDASRSRPTG